MSILDIAIVAIYVIAMLLMSIYLGKSNETQEDYLIAGRSLP